MSTPLGNPQTLREAIEHGFQMMAQNLNQVVKPYPSDIEIIHACVKDFLAQRFNVVTLTHETMDASDLVELYKRVTEDL